MVNSVSRYRRLIGAAAAIGLSACGGGGGGTTPPATNYLVGGTVSGLSGAGLVLRNNNGNDLSISVNGNFTFSGSVASGSAYSVSVQAQPASPWQTCLVTNGSGTVNLANVTNVTVTCTTNSYYVSGTIAGMAGADFAVQLNGGAALAVPADGNFAFTTPVLSGTPYTVSVGHQPVGPGQTCSIAGATGTVGGTNISNVAVTCVVLPFSDVVVSLAAQDMAWNPTTAQLYVSVTDYNGGGPAIVVADARDGTIVRAIPTSSVATPMAVTDDNKYLYVGLPGTSEIQRYTLPGIAQDIRFGIGVDSSGVPLVPVDIAAMPGQSQTIAVGREYTSSLPYVFGVAIFDDSAVRSNAATPSVGAGFYGVSWSTDGAEFYTADFSGQFCMIVWPVNASGMTPDPCTLGVFYDASGFLFGMQYSSVDYFMYRNFQTSGGRIYSTQGLIYEAATRRMIGRFHTKGQSEVIDPVTNKAFFAQGDTSAAPVAIESFNLGRVTPLATQSVPGTSGAVRKLLRWGPYGLAAVTDNGELILASGTFVSDVAVSSVAPSATSLVSESGTIGAYQYQSMPLTGYDVAWDATRGRVYASIDGTNPIYGNAVVAIDPTSGLITGAAAVGSDPTALSLSDSGQKLYVAHAGSSKVVRVDVPTMTTDATVYLNGLSEVAGFAFSVDALPGSDVTHVGAFGVAVCCGAGVYVADDSVIRPAVTYDFGAVSRWANTDTVYSNFGAVGLYTIQVVPSGIGSYTLTPNVFGNGGPNEPGLYVDNGLLYDDEGFVYDPVAQALVGVYAPPEGAYNTVVSPSSLRNRAYLAYTDSGSILTLCIFQLDTRALLDCVKFPGAFGAPISMTSMGTLGIVFTTTDHRIVTLSGPTL